MARLHSLTKLWLQSWFVGLWQCVQCGSAIVLNNVRWQKNKKHRVGLSVGSWVFSIFRFSVLSQWFTFQFFYVVVCLLHLAVTTEAMGTGGLRDCRLVDKQSSSRGHRATKYLVSQPVNIGVC